MIYLDHIIVKTYGGLTIRESLEASGSGGGNGGPPKKDAPVKKPKKKK